MPRRAGRAWSQGPFFPGRLALPSHQLLPPTCFHELLNFCALSLIFVASKMYLPISCLTGLSEFLIQQSLAFRLRILWTGQGHRSAVAGEKGQRGPPSLLVLPEPWVGRGGPGILHLPNPSSGGRNGRLHVFLTANFLKQFKRGKGFN